MPNIWVRITVYIVYIPEMGLWGKKKTFLILSQRFTEYQPHEKSQLSNLQAFKSTVTATLLHVNHTIQPRKSW